MIVKPSTVFYQPTAEFESSVNSYDSQTYLIRYIHQCQFESSVNSYDSQT